MKTTRTLAANRYHRALLCLFYSTMSLHLMVGCSVLPTQSPVTESASWQNQRSANAFLDLLDIQEIDALIKVDNRWLATHFENVLKAQGMQNESYKLKNIEISFSKQIIYLEALTELKDEYGNSITAALQGEILLKYRDDGLEWRPRFTHLEIINKNFSFDNSSYALADPELSRVQLEKLNTDLTVALAENSSNTIALNPVPLGEIQVGATLPEFATSSSLKTQSLKGIFITAGSVVKTDSSGTSIALDLTFIPDLSTCPADVTVSRGEFTSDVQSREPVDIARNMNSAEDVRYFFSEIAGAKRPLTVIHYWFADGLPVTAEELPVGPSERWRTWSASGTDQSDVSHWKVLVVEKESGCILASKSIYALEPDRLLTRVNQDQADGSFMEFDTAFKRRNSAFQILDQAPGIALIELRRPFFQNVLQASIADLNISAEFDGSSLSLLLNQAQLQPFEAGEITCENRDCTPAPVCKTNLAQCKRLRDTRDCSSCQFRNPLNNRCVSEAVDPLCEAARNRQNAWYDAERKTCITRAEYAKQECDLLNAQALSSCKIESGFLESTCESVKAGLVTLKQGAPLAVIKSQTHLNGDLSVSFSNFQIEGDLERLKLDMSLRSRLQLQGELSFNPANGTEPLAECIAAWNAPFNNRFTGTSVVNNLMSNIVQKDGMLTAQWSGFGVTIETRPSPVESVFVANPELLANCKIGLTVEKIEQAIMGEDAAFYLGFIDLVIQALPTKINLAPATIEFDNTVYSAPARLSAQHLQFDIQK